MNKPILKYIKSLAILLGFFFTWHSWGQAMEIPEDFVQMTQEQADVRIDLRYASNNNFMGRVVKGYEVRKDLILTNSAYIALQKAIEEFKSLGYGVVVFDAYRAQKSVDDFVIWSRQSNDTLKKAEYYPDFEKPDLFKLGYIAAKSGHSRGSTVDLSIYDLSTGRELDMGSPFDFFGEISGVYYEELSAKAKQNRKILREVMIRSGFKIYPEEWWHFTLKKEPHRDSYFDF